MDFLTTAKAQAVSVALEQATGVKPTVQDMGDYIRIYWNEVDRPGIQAKIEELISREEPGTIRVEWMPVVTPVAIKKLLPYAALLVGAGFLIGKL